MKTTTYQIHIITTEPVLGLASADREILNEFIASKAPTAEAAREEVEAIPVAEQIEKATTIFPRDETGLFWWDYQMRGAFKGFLSALIELGDCKISKWAYKRVVDQFLFVNPCRIYLLQPNSNERWTKAPSTLQRPLRATTMQGDRIALASSEMLPPGTHWTMDVTLLTGSNTKTKLAVLREADLRACLDYGVYNGFGQWRGGGYGRFSYVMNEKT